MPAGFTNLHQSLLYDNQEYIQTTISSGKRLLFISNLAADYETAADVCSRHGADILLPAEAENDEVKEFLRVQEWAGNFQRVESPFAWLRVLNLDVPTGQRWVDAKTNEPLTWDGGEGGLLSSSYEPNDPLFLDFQDHASNSHSRAYTGNLMATDIKSKTICSESTGKWKGIENYPMHDPLYIMFPLPGIVCELPGRGVF